MKRRIIAAVAIGLICATATFLLLQEYTDLDIIRLVYGSGIACVAGLTATLCALDDTEKILKEKERNADKTLEE